MNLRDYLKKYQMTQRELAEGVGVCKQTITSICDNRYNPSVSLAEKIEKFTNGQVTIIDIRRCTRYCLPGCPCSKNKKSGSQK